MVGLKLLLVLAFMTVFMPSAQGEIEVIAISKNLTIDAGKSALLACVAFNTENISADISWSRNGESIHNSSSSILTSEDVVHRYQLFGNSFLLLCEAQHLESGNYSCTVRNETSSISVSLEVIINDVLEMVIISNSSVVSVGDSVLLVCMGFGQPSINFSWSREGEEIIKDSSHMLAEEDIELGGRLYRLSLLKICSIQTCHSGDYNCSISNGISVVTASVEVMVEGNSLNITSISNKTTVTSGNPMELTCIGQPGNFVNISWSFNGKTVASNEGVSIVDEIDQTGSDGGKKSILRYRMTRSEDSGMHVCVVSNECSSDRSEVEVSIQTLIMTSMGSSSSGFSTNILIVITVAAAMLAVLIISFMVIVIYCVIKKKHKKNTSMPYPTTSNLEEDCIYDEIGKGTSLSKDYNNAKSSNENALYEYPMPSPGRTCHNNYKKPASFSMTKINDTYEVVNNNNSGNFPEMDANAAYESIQAGNDDAVEDLMYSNADQP